MPKLKLKDMGAYGIEKIYSRPFTVIAAVMATLLASTVWLFASGRFKQADSTAGPEAVTKVTYSVADAVYPPDINFYNVKDYGASGDGSSDDTAAIKRAIHAALSGVGQSSKGPGGRGSTVYFPSGTYLISDSLVWAQYGNGDAQVKAQVDASRGCVTSFSVVGGGSGYNATQKGGPGLLFSGGGGSGIQAYTTLINGSVAGVVVDRSSVGTSGCWGHGYVSSPNVTVVNWRAYLRFEGQNKDTTTIRLQDATPQFANGNCNIAWQEKLPRENCHALLYTASEIASNSDGNGEDAYMNDIWNLTVDSGSSNPGAIGIDWAISNRGSIRNVNIISEDGEGRCGLSVSRSFGGSGNGPGYVKNVAIKGFDFGIVGNADASEIGITFEHIDLADQKVGGVFNANMPDWFRGVSSVNSVPVFANAGTGSLEVIDGDFVGGSSSVSAIVNSASATGGLLYTRNITTAGYRSALVTTNSLVVGSSIAEYSSNGGTSRSLNLPVPETPEWVDNNFSDWADVSTFSPDSHPNSGKDATAGIQSALNSGKPVIFFPYGVYYTTSTLHIPGTVRKILGSNSQIGGYPWAARQQFPTFSCDSTTGNAIEIRTFVFDLSTVGYPTFLDKCSSDLVVADVHNANGFVGAPGTSGRVFLENVSIPGPSSFTGQSLYAHQYDIESGESTHLTIQNAPAAWILGYKTEGAGQLLNATNSTVEILGAFNSHGNAQSTGAAYSFVDSIFSLSGLSMYPGWPSAIMETNNNVSHVTSVNGQWQGGTGISLYVGQKQN